MAFDTHGNGNFRVIIYRGGEHYLSFTKPFDSQYLPTYALREQRLSAEISRSRFGRRFPFVSVESCFDGWDTVPKLDKMLQVFPFFFSFLLLILVYLAFAILF